MTAAAARTFPVPRTYQTWLRELASVHPRRLWFSHLLVHRVEALVVVASRQRLEPLSLSILRRLFVSLTLPARDAILETLRFDRQLAIPLLRELAAAGLVQAADGGWTLTEAGREAPLTGTYTRRTEERRVFSFADNPAAAPQYLPLTQTAGPVADLGDSWSFSPGIIDECVHRSSEWKQRVHFPADVEAVLVEPRDGWRQVILDRAEHAPLLFVETAGPQGGSLLTAYLVRCDHWTLNREQPALLFVEGWQELLPDFAEGFALEAWRPEWLAWCQARQLPATEAAACHLDYSNCKLHVKAPKALVELLKAARSEVLRGESWLTLGTGRTRAVACLDIHEQAG